MPHPLEDVGCRLEEMQCFDEKGYPASVTGAAFYALQWLRELRQAGALDLWPPDMRDQERHRLRCTEHWLQKTLEDVAFGPTVPEEVTIL
jgi:hypothetical protein